MSERGMRPPKQEPPMKVDARFIETVQRITDLRRAEGRGGAILERTNFILSLFMPDPGQNKSFVEEYLEKGADTHLWPDANGLKIDIGPDGPLGIHSHIPYEHISKALLERMRVGGVFESEYAEQETMLRVAEAAGDMPEVKRLSEAQEKALRSAIPEAPDASIDVLLRKHPAAVAEACMESGVYVPRASLQFALTGTGSENVIAAVSIASALNGGYKGADGDGFYIAQHPEAWKNIHASTEASRFSKQVFTSRSELLHSDPHTADTSKILTTIFETHSCAALRARGIEAVRGAYKDGLQFIGFFSGDRYERVLIDPKKHIRGSDAQRNYESIPLVSNSDFEAFEGFLLPYVQFQTLERELTKIFSAEGALSSGALADAKSYVEGTISLLASEMSPEMYEPFLLSGRELLQALAVEPLKPEAVEAFRGHLKAIQERYANRFSGISIPEILDTYLKIPERVQISYTEDFIRGSGDEAKQNALRSFLESLPEIARRTPVTLIKSGSDNGIPFTHEARALRALKITPRPTLVLAMGAKFENMDSQESLDAIADSIISAGKETNANIVMQGGQSGRIVETVVRKYWEYRAGLPEGAEPFRIIGIEPGQSTYAGPAGYPQREDQESHPMLPIDSIHTPFVAGWSPGQENIWQHSYLPHLVYRQAVIRHMSEGHSTATLIINGGSWSMPESSESMKDGFVQIVLPESGRLAAMLGHLKETYATWSKRGVEGAIQELESFISQQPDEKRARMENDLVLGKQRGLYELIAQIKAPDAIKTTTAGNLKDALISALSEK